MFVWFIWSISFVWLNQITKKTKHTSPCAFREQEDGQATLTPYLLLANASSCSAPTLAFQSRL